MSGCCSAPLAEVVDQVSTWNPKKADPDASFLYIDLGAVDQTTKSVTAPRPVLANSAPSRARQLVAEGDVLVSTVRPNLNAVARVTAELSGATASTGFCVLRPRRDVLDPDYLFHWVRTPTFVAAMVRRATGANYPAISERVVLSSQLPLPALHEQRRISGLLDAGEGLVRDRCRAVSMVDQLTQSDLNTRFGDPVTNERGYKTSPMVDLVDPSRPITYGILKPGPHQPHGAPYVRVVDMRDGGIDLRSIRNTTPAISAEYKRSRLRPGDLLISIRGHVGRVAETPEELDGANITQDTARLAVTGANPLFVRECLRSPALQHWMARHTKGVAVRGINLGDIKRLPLILPPASEQEAFAELARHVDSLRARQVESLRLMEQLFASLQQRTLVQA